VLAARGELFVGAVGGGERRLVGDHNGVGRHTEYGRFASAVESIGVAVRS